MKVVSIVVPIYKVEKYLCDCLDSILSQTYKELQILLIDDGSPDGSGAICDEYALKDDRIVVIHSRNGGLSAARNRGLSLCEGEYILFLDSDDWLEKDAVEVLFKNAEKKQLDILLYDAISFDEYNPRPDDTEVNKYIRKHAYPSLCTGAELFFEMLSYDEYRSPVQYCFYRKSFISEHAMSFHEGILHEDEEFNFFALLNAQRVGHINDVLYHHRFRTDSIMGTKITKRNVDSCYEIVLKAINKSDHYLSDSQTADAYRTGLARLIRIYYNRVMLSDSSDSPDVQTQIKELRTILKQVKYFDDKEIKNAVLDKKKKDRIKNIKMKIYPIIAPVLRRSRQ